MSFDIAPVDELNRDTTGEILNYLEPSDILALLNATATVRNNTLVALPVQQRLWAAARVLNVENVMSALSEGARVNKIDPNVLNEDDKSYMNAFAIVEQIKESSKRRIEASEEVLKILREKGGKPLKLEDLNNHLVDCVKRVAVFDSGSDSYSDLLKRIEEALLDGADPNTRTTYSEKLSDNKEKTKEGGLLHVLTVQPEKDEELIVATIKQLKKFGIDMNQVDKKLDSDDDNNDDLIKHFGEETALHYACIAHLRPDKKWDNLGVSPIWVDFRVEIVRALLESGIDVNKQNSEGDTALHFLVRYSASIQRPVLQEEDVEIAKLLLSFGADLYIENNKKEPPYYANVETNLIAKLLDTLKNGWNNQENFIIAVQEGNVNDVQKCIKKGAPVNTVIFYDEPDESDFIPILFDSFGNFYKENISKEDAMAIVKLLLDQPQSNVNVVDSVGNTAIVFFYLGSLAHLNDQCMMQKWRVDFVHMLIEKGIDLRIKNKDGKTILDWFEVGKNYGKVENEEIIKLVREKFYETTSKT
jgi:ankyrin repeat protein